MGGKDKDSKCLGSCHPCRSSRLDSKFPLHLGPVLATPSIWKVNQQIKKRSVSYMGGTDQSIWAIFSYVPRHGIKKVDQRQSSQDFNWHSGRKFIIISSGLMHCATCIISVFIYFLFQVYVFFTFYIIKIYHTFIYVLILSVS